MTDICEHGRGWLVTTQDSPPRPVWHSEAPPLRYVRPFDGLRCIGALGVLIGHTDVWQLHGFNAFVDMFLVVSGLLITTMLLQEHRETNTIDLRRFYERRAIRLVPTVWFTVIAFATFTGLLCLIGVVSVFSWKEILTEAPPALTYTYNIAYPYFNGQWFAPLWTVGLEEQFYLVIGAVILVAVRRGWIRQVAVLFAVLVVLIQVSRYYLDPGPLPDGLALAIWMQRPDALMVGVLAAIASAHLPTIGPRLRRALSIGTMVATVLLVLTILSATEIAEEHLPGLFTEWAPPDLDLSYRAGNLYWLNWGYTVSIWSIAVIAFTGFRVSDWKPAPYLSWAPMVWFGAKLSYVVYVIHYPIQRLIDYLFTPEQSHTLVGLPSPALLALEIAMPLLLAYPVYKYVERTALRLKRRKAVIGSIDR